MTFVRHGETGTEDGLPDVRRISSDGQTIGDIKTTERLFRNNKDMLHIDR